MGPILFLHIPRTGGTSMKKMFVNALGTERCLTDVHLLRIGRADGTDLGLFDFIEGHVPGGVFAATTIGPEWRGRAMTLLRDPVDRLVSHAVFLRNRPEPPGLHQGGDALMRPVTDPQSALEGAWGLHDIQTRFLGSATRQLAPVADEEIFEVAKSILDECAIGLTEQFATSTALLADHYGVRLSGADRANGSDPGTDADLRGPEFRNAATAVNRFDRRLYEYAVMTFDRRVRAHVEGLDAMPADAGILDVRWHAPVATGDGGLYVGRYREGLRIRGTALLDGVAPEAVVVRAAGNSSPIGCRFPSVHLARETGAVERLYAGFDGVVSIGSDTATIELIAFDRIRRRRGSVTLELVRERHPDL